MKLTREEFDQKINKMRIDVKDLIMSEIQICIASKDINKLEEITKKSFTYAIDILNLEIEYCRDFSKEVLTSIQDSNSADDVVKSASELCTNYAVLIDRVKDFAGLVAAKKELDERLKEKIHHETN